MGELATSMILITMLIMVIMMFYFGLYDNSAKLMSTIVSYVCARQREILPRSAQYNEGRALLPALVHTSSTSAHQSSAGWSSSRWCSWCWWCRWRWWCWLTNVIMITQVFPEMRNSSNFCRNGGGIEHTPWCYTMDPLVRWQHCHIEKCGEWFDSSEKSKTFLRALIEAGEFV